MEAVPAAGRSSVSSVPHLSGAEAGECGSGGGVGVTSLASSVLWKVSVVPIGMRASESEVSPRSVELPSELVELLCFMCVCVSIHTQKKTHTTMPLSCIHFLLFSFFNLRLCILYI